MIFIACGISNIVAMNKSLCPIAFSTNFRLLSVLIYLLLYFIEQLLMYLPVMLLFII